MLHMKNMEEHFSEIAETYNEIRTTDQQPIDYIREFCFQNNHRIAVDIGCGPGRYSLLLLQAIPQLHLTCVDQSSIMIAQTERLLRNAKLDRFKTFVADAGELPLDSNSVDLVFTFNAIHHFIMPAFLREARRVLKANGAILIYTRLQTQNETSIWGKHFPDFNMVERRLYSLDSIEAAIRSIPGLTLDAVKLFRYERIGSLEGLIDKARARHYSTFSLYSNKRLEECISVFKANLARNFSDADHISWIDENVLLAVKACEAATINGQTYRPLSSSH
jgi:ubiquinone/menaquinone biosynthesis C-methylase UbiE